VPLPPTSGTGGSISTVPGTVPRGPRKLPPAGTDPRIVAEQSRAPANEDTVSSSVPTNQPMARNF
jgi:hypothetical protein